MTTIGFFSAGHSLDEYEKADCVARNFDDVREFLSIGDFGELTF